MTETGNPAMRMFVKPFLHVLLAMCVLSGAPDVCSIARAQVPAVPSSDTDQNKKLRVELDCTKIHAFEPVYLCLTAEQFALGAEPEVQMRRGDGEWQPLTIDKKDWVKSDTAGSGSIPVRRLGTVLQTQQRPRDPGQERQPAAWLFATPGEYKFRVKMGPDST